MRNKKYLFLIIPFIFFYFCEKLHYNPSKATFTEIDQTNINNPVINFPNEQDTLLIWGKTTFQFDIDRQSYNINVYINNVKIGNVQNSTSYQMNTTNYTAGIYTMKFEFFLSSGTGSLADRLNSEIILNARERIVEIDNDLPTPVKLDSLQWNKDALTLRWSKNEDDNFLFYSIERKCYSAYYPYYEDGIIDTITNQSIVEYIDTTVYPIYGRDLTRCSVKTHKHNGNIESNIQPLNCGHLLPLQSKSYNPEAIKQTRPIASRSIDEIYLYDEYHGDLIAISDDTHNIIKRFTNAYSSDPSFVLDSDDNRIILLNDIYNNVSIINLHDFSLIQEIQLIEKYWHPKGPIAITTYDDILFRYKWTGSLYMLNPVSEDEKFISNIIWYSKQAISLDGKYLYILGNETENNLKKFELVADSASLVNMATIQLGSSIGDTRSGVQKIQVDNMNEYLYIQNDYTTIEKYNTMTLKLVDKIIIPQATNGDMIYDFFVHTNALYISYSVGKERLNYRQFGKIVKYDISSQTVLQEWAFQCVPQTMTISRKKEYLYAIGFHFGTSRSGVFGYIVPLD